MRALVIFLTLWSSVFSIPATFEDYSHGSETINNILSIIPRTNIVEKRAVKRQTIIDDTNKGSPLENTQFSDSSNGLNSPEERTVVSIKKPILIKKKIGYRVYRNSDEELASAGSREKCSKQVKVKFCEDDTETNSHQMKHDSTFAKANDHMTKDEMKQRVKMVQDVVKHLQRDLEVMDDSSAADILSQDKHLRASNTETQLHDDFEVLHTILDDLVKNIGAVDDKNINKTKTEETRMAQWKEMTNIQENTGRNIEDRFKTEIKDKENDSKVIETDHLTKSSLNTPEQTQAITGTPLFEFRVNKEADVKDKPQSIDMTSRNFEGDTEISTAQDVNKKGNLHSDSLRVEQGTNNVVMTKSSEQFDTMNSDVNNKIIDDDHMLQNMGPEHAVMKNDFSDLNGEKVIENFKMNEENTATEDLTLMNSESNIRRENSKTIDGQQTLIKRKSDETEDHLNTESNDFKSPTSNEINKLDDGHSINPNEMGQTSDTENRSQNNDQDHKDTNKKTDEINNDQRQLASKQNAHYIETDTVQQMKTPNSLGTTIDNHHHFVQPSREAIKGLEIQKAPDSQLNSEISKNVITVGKAMSELGKRGENLQHQFNGHLNTRWAQVGGIDTSMPGTLNMEKINLEGRSGIHSHDSMNSEHFMNHHQHAVNRAEHMHRAQETFKHEHSGRAPLDEHFASAQLLKTTDSDFPLTNGEAHSLGHHDRQLGNGRLVHDFYRVPSIRADVEFGGKPKMDVHSHHNFNTPRERHFSPEMSPSHTSFHREQVTDEDNMVQASDNIGMREALLRSAIDYSQSYRQNEGTIKGPKFYHEQLTPPTGAVGLFPNANVGSCGIPLLLSCSPSVVSGTLAKNHNSYNTPSFRSMDAYRYHKKRETNNPNSKLDLKTNPKIIGIVRTVDNSGI